MMRLSGIIFHDIGSDIPSRLAKRGKFLVALARPSTIIIFPSLYRDIFSINLLYRFYA